jgi:hypothetical protein
MMFGENTQGTPFEIIDAREAQHKASEAQREHGDALAKAHVALADAEYTYRTALVARIKQLKEDWPATTCDNIARGEESIAQLRRERDKREGELETLKDKAYTIAADRRALDGLIDWSMRRDLRVDAEPLQWPRPEGAGVPPGVDPKTGELVAA